MTIAKTLRTLVLMVSAVGIFAAGYFWALRGMDHEMSVTAQSGDTAGMKGMENMAGMENMSGMQSMSGMGSGMVKISPEKQQLVGVRTGVVEKKPLVKTVRTVGVIAYDETKLSQVYSKVEGWIDKLYVNFTGKLVEKGQPLFTIYSPDLLATQLESRSFN